MNKNRLGFWLRAHRRRISLAGIGFAAAAAVISCSTVTRTIFAPPQVPGATFAGDASCAQCHPQQVKDFQTSTHARLKAPGDNAKDVGCESCHGAGSIHNESGGARGTIINPRKSPETCFQCHADKRGEFSLPHHHPVVEGKVGCGDCHDPHKGDAVIGGGTNLQKENETCAKCHTAQFGPFVFEHEAMREGCTTCHQPHGSVNDKMLVTRSAALCVKCHFEQNTAAGIFIGNSDHTSRLARGSCWSAGCHEAVHGSQVSPANRY